MLADFHFLRPACLLAIPLVIAAGLGFAYRRLGAGSWATVIDPRLAPFVLSGTQTSHRDSRWLLLTLVGVLGVIALAGPVWDRIAQPVYRSEQALVIALDLSRSMDAQDVAPSRLVRARLKILDLLEQRAGGQTALLVYSANAFTVTPLTSDTDTVAALVNSLSTDIMPSRGSYPVAAINKGRQLLEQAAVSVGEILLITDGGSSPAAERVARDLRKTGPGGYTLSVLGVGTRQGAPIPRASGGFVTGRSGQMAVPKLEENALRALAAAGGGRYASLSADNRDLDYLLAGEVSTGGASDDLRASDQWREEGPWILLLLLPLAAMAFRRGWALVFIVAMLPLTRPAEASLWDDLWLNKNQQARVLLDQGEPEAAAALFDSPQWRGVSKYRAGDYAASAAEFAEHGDTRSLYNLGNALAKQGELESAVDAFDQVLELDPANEDAAYNRELLKQALEQQQQQQGQQNQQQESSESPGEQGEGSDQPADPDQQSGSSGDADNPSKDDDASPRPDDEAAEQDLDALQDELQRAAEQAGQQDPTEPQMSEAELAELRRQQAEEQAMEQWLRRIPNDPGGLLRRKFRYQYQKMGKDQDGNNLWPDNEEQPW